MKIKLDAGIAQTLGEIGVEYNWRSLSDVANFLLDQHVKAVSAKNSIIEIEPRHHDWLVECAKSHGIPLEVMVNEFFASYTIDFPGLAEASDEDFDEAEGSNEEMTQEEIDQLLAKAHEGLS